MPSGAEESLSVHGRWQQKETCFVAMNEKTLYPDAIHKISKGRGMHSMIYEDDHSGQEALQGRWQFLTFEDGLWLSS